MLKLSRLPLGLLALTVAAPVFAQSATTTTNPTPPAVRRLQNLKKPGSKRYAHGYAFINDKGVPEYVCDGCTPQH